VGTKSTRLLHLVLSKFKTAPPRWNTLLLLVAAVAAAAVTLLGTALEEAEQEECSPDQ
jgi:hypothetical protein